MLRSNLQQERCSLRTVLNVVENAPVLLVTTNECMFRRIVMVDAYLRLPRLLLCAVLKPTTAWVSVVFSKDGYDVGCRQIAQEPTRLVQLSASACKVRKLHLCIYLALRWCLQ